MANDLDVARVLEDAATLYEDEKIEWCTGSWVEKTDRGEVETLSMCAEGALMKAAGLRDSIIWNFQKHSGLRCDTYLRNQDNAAYDQYATARDLVDRHVGGYGVTGWNDERAGGKQGVIDTFREVAKDLRNRAPAEEL